MKYLLDNKLAPLTFNWGFLEASVDAVGAAYQRWHKKILHSVKIASVDLSLEDALRRLEPLDFGSQRVLFLSTKSRWTACFDNGVKGGNPSTVVGELSQQMKCRGVTCGSVPNTLTKSDVRKPGTWGAVKFTLFAPEEREFLNIERSLSVINDVRGWTFNTVGKVQGFEQVDRYAARKIADRFTAEMLEDYCRVFGIDLFNEDFYGGKGLVIFSYPWFLPKAGTTTLAEARRQLGLSD